MQEVFNFKIEPSHNITMYVQSPKLHRGCINEVLGNCLPFSIGWQSIIYLHLKVVGRIYLVEWTLMLTPCLLIKKLFSRRNYNEKLDIEPWLYPCILWVIACHFPKFGS